MILGQDAIIQFRLNDINFTDFICATDCAIDTVTETVSTKTVGDGSWNRLAVQSRGYTVTLSGLIPLDGSLNNNAFDLLSTWMQGKSVRYRMIFTDENGAVRIIEGQLLVTSNSFKGPSTGFATGDVTLEGEGPFILSSLPCTTTLGNKGGDWGALQIYVFFDVPATTIKAEYELFRNGKLYQKGSVNTGDEIISVYFPSLPYGSYHVIFYPICSSGLSGIAQEDFFILAPPCINVGIVGSPTLPDGVVGEIYEYEFELSGSEPFDLTINQRPAWLEQIYIEGNTVKFWGVPTEAGNNIEVDITITNCSSGSVNFNDTFNVPVPTEGKATIVLIGDDINTLCSQPYTTIYYWPGEIDGPTTGDQIWSDISMTNPVTETYIVFPDPIGFAPKLFIDHSIPGESYVGEPAGGACR